MEKNKIVCKHCFELVALVDASMRCDRCFSPKAPSQDICGRCVDGGAKFAACFENVGPVATLLHAYTLKKCFWLSSVLAPFFVLQYEQLGWDMPDLIVSVPQTRSRRFLCGYNPSLLLAREVAKLFGIKVVSLLRRKEEQGVVSSNIYSWKKKVDVKEKTLLLVDDYFELSGTLLAAANCLGCAFPKKVYGMAVSVKE